MNIEREDTGTLTATLKVKLTPEDYNPGVERTLKEQRKTASLPGFRPGQVPMTLIKKRIGKSVLVNEVERLIDENMRHWIQQNGIRPLGQPLPQNDNIEGNNWDEPGEFNFQYELGLAPKFDVELNEKFGVDYPVVNVDDALVEKEIADMQRRFGSMADADVADEKDMLLGDLIELDETGSIKVGGLMNRTTISLEYLKNDNARQLFIGKAKADEVHVDPHTISDSHDDLARMLNTDHEGVHHLHGNMLFRIAEIKRMMPVPVDQVLFDRVFGKDAVSEEAGFRIKVKEGLENSFRRDSDRVFKRLVLKNLEEKAAITLPDAFLKKWIARTSKKPVTPEEVEAGYNNYANGLKRQLVEDRILEKYGLEAKGEEIDNFAKRYITDQFMQYGMTPPEGEELQRSAGRILSDREQVKRMRDSIVDQKLTVHFKNMLSPAEKRFTFDEFVNLARTA